MKQFRNKRIYAILLTVLMLLGSVMGVYAEELITGVGDWLVDIGISEDSIDDYPVEDELLAQAATACSQTVPIAGYGSTGRTEPRNLHEQLAMEACMADPFGGEMFSVCERLSDERWNGWQKWQYTSRSSNGDIVVIHFNYDGEYWYDDFKFVN